jgi:single-strand DNA-binding protein
MIMNSLRNRVQLIGNLGMDPEVKTYGDGKKMVRFSIATTDSYKNNDGKKITETQWHNIVIWGGALAEVAEKFLVKGKEVAVEGKLVHRNYEDKDGNKRYVTDIVVNELLLLGKNGEK